MGKSVKQQLSQLLAGVEFVSPAIFDQLLTQTAASPNYLKRLLRDQGIPLHPFIEGVRQDNLHNLTRTLTALSDLYPEHPSPSRAIVLESKTHTKLLLLRNPEDPWRKQVLLHLNTWLENPVIYPIWSQLQMRSAAAPLGCGGAS